MEGVELRMKKKTENREMGGWRTWKDTRRKIKETETKMRETRGGRDRGGHKQAL